MRKAAVGDDFTYDEEPEHQCGNRQFEEFLSDEQRDLMVECLALYGLPTREIIRITGASGRTVARTMQRLGIQRTKPERLSASRKRHSQRLVEVLTEYYALQEVTLDSLNRIARRNGLPLEKLLDLVREHVSPSRWAIRTCLACGQPALTSSPSDRYCPNCKKKVKKVREGISGAAIYE